ncbi:MAG: hypothetical protein V7L02_06655 [Nostoc sp.]|uniref:DUF7689 domain-containing protein n=1 Tax=Nostoc sp. TaxID=1180 RepID=UPI002FF6DC1D
MEELQISEIEATFTALVKQWREETFGISSTNQMSMHPAYQQIIGMGKPVRAAEDDETWWWPDQFYWPLSVPREETIEAFQQAFETLGYEVCQGDVLEEGLQRIAIYSTSRCYEVQ